MTIGTQNTGMTQPGFVRAIKKSLRAAEICETLGTGGQVIFQSEHMHHYSGRNRLSLRMAMKELREIYIPDYELDQAMALVGTLGGSVKITETNEECDAWIIMWLTHSRPLGVIVLPVSTFIFTILHLIQDVGP